MSKTPDEQIDDFARVALQAGMARAAMTQARRDARGNGARGGDEGEVQGAGTQAVGVVRPHRLGGGDQAGGESAAMIADERIKAALDVAVRYGGIDGDHHKAWVIDQMVRALTGCPTVQKTADLFGQPYTYDAMGESDEYRELVRKAKAGDDGPDTYDWDVGIVP